MEAVSPARAEVGLDATDGEVHLRQAPGGVVELLAVDGDVVAPPAVGLDEALGLHEHAARPAAGVVHPAGEGFDHVDEETHHDSWGVELAATLAFRRGELTEEVLVDPAEDVLLPVLGRTESDARNEVDQLAEAAHVEAGPGVGLG